MEELRDWELSIHYEKVKHTRKQVRLAAAYKAHFVLARPRSFFFGRERSGKLVGFNGGVRLEECIQYEKVKHTGATSTTCGPTDDQENLSQHLTNDGRTFPLLVARGNRYRSPARPERARSRAAISRAARDGCPPGTTVRTLVCTD
jgi:hypothetical protein